MSVSGDWLQFLHFDILLSSSFGVFLLSSSDMPLFVAKFGLPDLMVFPFVSLELAPFALDLGTLALSIFGRKRGGEGLGIKVQIVCLMK